MVKISDTPPLFGKMQDNVFLSFPLIFFLTLAVGMSTGIITAPRELTMNNLDFLFDIIFFGALHIYLGFWMTLFNAKIANWMKERNRKSVISFSQQSLLIAGLTFLIFGTYSNLWTSSDTISSIVSFVILVLFPVALGHHSVTQIRGISAIYRQQQLSRLSPKELLDFDRCYNREKMLFNIFLFIFVVPAAIDTAITILKLNFLGIHLTKYPWILVCVMLGILFLIIINQVFAPTGWDRRRSLYTFRLCAWATLPINPFGVALVSSIHGLEYTFIVAKMSSDSKKISNQKILLYSFVLFLGLGLLLRAAKHEWLILNISGQKGSFMITFFYTLAALAPYIHMQIDHELFAMKKLENQKFIAPLLIKPATDN